MPFKIFLPVLRIEGNEIGLEFCANDYRLGIFTFCVLDDRLYVRVADLIGKRDLVYVCRVDRRLGR